MPIDGVTPPPKELRSKRHRNQPKQQQTIISVSKRPANKSLYLVVLLSMVVVIVFWLINTKQLITRISNRTTINKSSDDKSLIRQLDEIRKSTIQLKSDIQSGTYMTHDNEIETSTSGIPLLDTRSNATTTSREYIKTVIEKQLKPKRSNENSQTDN